MSCCHPDFLYATLLSELGSLRDPTLIELRTSGTRVLTLELTSVLSPTRAMSSGECVNSATWKARDHHRTDR